MITLNNINLSSIDLSGIDLRGVKLGVGGRGGGSGDGFPQLPGDVTRWHFGGLTNEMMAAMDDPRIEDADHKGRFLSFKNFAWKGMSGVGGYVVDIDEWGTNSTAAYYERNSIKITATFKENASLGLLYHNIKLRQSCVLKVTGIPEGCDAFLDDRLGNRFYMSEDGVYEIIPSNFLAEALYLSIEKYPERWYRSKLTIEQLPLYPGFILSDGVDDFAVTEKELNFEDTYTVYTAFIPFQNNPANNMVLCGKNHLKDFYITYSDLNRITFYSAEKLVFESLSKGFNILCCKRTPDKMVIKNLITDKSSEILANDLIDNPGLYYLWKSAVFANYAKAAIAGQIIDNGHFTTDEDDEKVLDWYKKQYPWLFPDQAWTTVGKTNEDEDRATIANITGNRNDLVLSNFGFAEGSGYNEEGEYAGYLVTDGVNDQMNSSNFDLGKDFTIIGEWKFMNNIIANAGISKALSLFVYNTDNGLRVFINNTTKGPVLNTKTLKAICSDGRVYSDDWSEMIINEEQPITSSKSSLLIGINGNNFAKIALKNLAIYNQILSKDDCIKAYSYLQTLKAK